MSRGPVEGKDGLDAIKDHDEPEGHRVMLAGCAGCGHLR